MSHRAKTVAAGGVVSHVRNIQAEVEIINHRTKT